MKEILKSIEACLLHVLSTWKIWKLVLLSLSCLVVFPHIFVAVVSISLPVLIVDPLEKYPLRVFLNFFEIPIFQREPFKSLKSKILPIFTKTSNVQDITLRHKWVIKNFSSQNRIIFSSKFSHLDDLNNTWKLGLDPGSDYKFVTVSLYLLSSPNGATASFSISLKNAKQCLITNLNLLSIKADFTKDDNVVTIPIILRDELIAKIKAHNDTLLVICELEIESNKLEKKQISRETQSLNNWENLVNNPEYSDVILESSDHKKIYAHKAILSAMSPVFARMLEKETKKVFISDIDHETLFRLMSYIYCCKIPNADEINYTEKINLLIVAQKYDIPALEATMEESLILKIDQSNAVDLLTASYLYNKSKLKSFVIKFICCEQNESILETSKWNNMASKYPELMNECFKALFRFQNDSVNVIE